METVVTLMMLLTVGCFLLKQTFMGVRQILVTAVVVMMFVALMWPFAITQSKTQIASWLSNPQLMLDVAVLLSVDIALEIAFCVTDVDVRTSRKVSRRKRMWFRFLRHFPGLLVFPVFFAVLVWAIFALPGVDFALVGWSLGVALLFVLPLLAYLLRRLVPEEELRLELLFLCNLLLGGLGVIATVNGTTAVKGVSQVNYAALGAMAALILVFGGVGFVARRGRQKRAVARLQRKQYGRTACPSHP